MNLFLYSFSKYYGIFNSCSKLIEKLFKLSNIFYYRQKQNYITNNNVDIIKLKNDNKLLIDTKNKILEKALINQEFYHLFNMKISKDECYFTFIKSLNFLTKCIHEKNYNLIIMCNSSKRISFIIFIFF